MMNKIMIFVSVVLTTLLVFTQPVSAQSAFDSNPLIHVETDTNWEVLGYQLSDTYICTLHTTLEGGYEIFIGSSNYGQVSDSETALHRVLNFVVYIPNENESIPLFAPVDIRFLTDRENGVLILESTGQGEFINVWGSLTSSDLTNLGTYENPVLLILDNLQTPETDLLLDIDFTDVLRVYVNEYQHCVRTLYGDSSQFGE